LTVRAISFADDRGPDIPVRVAPQGEPELLLQANEFKPKRDVFAVRSDDWSSPWLSVQDLSCVHASARCKLLAIPEGREITGKRRPGLISRTLGLGDFPEKNVVAPDLEPSDFWGAPFSLALALCRNGSRAPETTSHGQADGFSTPPERLGRSPGILGTYNLRAPSPGRHP
jgi:hypothetical protein